MEVSCSYRTLLRAPEVQKDPRRYLQAVQKVIACMTLGINVSKLFSEMIMVRRVDTCVCFHRANMHEVTCIGRGEDLVKYEEWPLWGH